MATKEQIIKYYQAKIKDNNNLLAMPNLLEESKRRIRKSNESHRNHINKLNQST